MYSFGMTDLTKAAPDCPASRPQQKGHYRFTRYRGGEYVKESGRQTEVRAEDRKNQVFSASMNRVIPIFGNRNVPLSGYAGERNVVVSVYSLSGRIKQQRVVRNQGSNSSVELGLPPGIYLVALDSR